MNSDEAWAKGLGIQISQLQQWKLQAGNSNLLRWGIVNGKIHEAKYLEWAKNFYQLPCLEESFFDQSPNPDLWIKWGAQNWSGSFLPIYEWDSVLYVACLEPPTASQFEIIDNIGIRVNLLLAPLSGMKKWWHILSPNSTKSTKLPPELAQFAVQPGAKSVAPKKENTSASIIKPGLNFSEELVTPTKSVPKETSPDFISIDMDLKPMPPPPIPKDKLLSEDLGDADLISQIPNMPKAPLDAMEAGDYVSPNLANIEVPVTGESEESILDLDISNPYEVESTDLERHPSLEDLNVVEGETSEGIDLDFNLSGPNLASTPEINDSDPFATLLENPVESSVRENTASTAFSFEKMQEEVNNLAAEAPSGLDFSLNPIPKVEEVDSLLDLGSLDIPKEKTPEQNNNVAEEPEALIDLGVSENFDAEEGTCMNVSLEDLHLKDENLSHELIREESVILPAPGQIAKGNFVESSYGKNLDDDFKLIAAEAMSRFSKIFEKSMILVAEKWSMNVSLWTLNWNYKQGHPAKVELVESSIFKIVSSSKMSYHGYVVKNQTNSNFFNAFNEGAYPEHCTVVPVLYNNNTVAMVLGICSSSVAESIDLSACEEIAKDMSSHLAEIQKRASSSKPNAA